jgi:opacity protein-like surface antigen
LTRRSLAGTAGASANSRASDSVAGSALGAGLGLAWNPTKHVKLRAEHIRYGNVGDKDTTGEVNIDTLNAGLTYSVQPIRMTPLA